MVHLVTKNGIACAAGNSRTESTFEVTTRAKVCTCPQCLNTDAFRTVLAWDNEPCIELNLKKRQYVAFLKGLSWLIETIEEGGDLKDREEFADLLHELEYQEKS